MASNINPNPFTTRPEIDGTFGVVTSTHWIATAVGMGMLGTRRQCLRRRGGHRLHAAGGRAASQRPGGDVPVIVHDVRKGKVEVICGQGPAPAGATIAHYRGDGLDLVPGTGLLACCVPGTFETWMLLLRDYGTMTLADVLTPAIGYAQNGHPLVERANATIKTVEQLFREHWPTSAAVYLPGGKVPERRHAVHQQGDGGDLCAHPARGRERGRRPRAPDRESAPVLVARFCRRGDRPLLPHAGGDGLQRRAPPRRAHRRRHGALAARTSKRRSRSTMAATPSARAGSGARGR